MTVFSHLIFQNMTTKFFYFLLFTFFTCNIYSQESYPIIFSNKGEITVISQDVKSEVKTLRADIILKQGKFSILLIDYNNNGVFTDYRGCCRDIGSDGIIIMDFKENKKIIQLNKRRFITKNLPLIFNTETFSIKNLRVNNEGTYIANLVKEKIELSTIFKTRNKVLIDTLSNIRLLNYYNKKPIFLREKLYKNDILYLRIMSQEEFVTYLKYGDKSDKFIRKYFPNHYKIVNVVIIHNRGMYNYIINKWNKSKKEFLTIMSSDKQKMAQLGYNMSEISKILFNDKGDVICTDFDSYIITKELKDN